MFNKKRTTNTNTSGSSKASVKWLDDEFFPEISLLEMTYDSTMDISSIDLPHPGSTPQTPLSARAIRIQEQVVDVNLNNMSPIVTQNVELKNRSDSGACSQNGTVDALPPNVSSSSVNNDAQVRGKQKWRFTGFRSSLTPTLKNLKIGMSRQSVEPVRHANNQGQSTPFFSLGNNAATPQGSISNTNTLGSPHAAVKRLDDEFFPEISLLEVTYDSTMDTSSIDLPHPGSRPQTPLSARAIRIQEQIVDVNLNNMSPAVSQNVELTSVLSPHEKLQSFEFSQKSVEHSLQKSRLSPEQTTAGEDSGNSSQNSTQELSNTLTGNITQDQNSVSDKSVVDKSEGNIEKRLELTQDLFVGCDLENGRHSLGSDERLTANMTTLASGHSDVTRDLNLSNDTSALRTTRRSSSSDNRSFKNVTLDLHVEHLETSNPTDYGTKQLDCQMDSREVKPPILKNSGSVNTTFTSIQPTKYNTSINLTTTTEIQPPHNRTVDLTPSDTDENIKNSDTVNLTHSTHETADSDLHHQNKTMDLNVTSIDHRDVPQDGFVDKPMTVSTASELSHPQNQTFDRTTDVGDQTFESNVVDKVTAVNTTTELSCPKNISMDLTTNQGAQTQEIKDGSLNTSSFSKSEQSCPQNVAGQTFDNDAMNASCDADASSSKSEKLCTLGKSLDLSPPTVCGLHKEFEDTTSTASINSTSKITSDTELPCLQRKTLDPLIKDVSSVTVECETPAEVVFINTSIKNRSDSSQNATVDALPPNVSSSSVNNDVPVESVVTTNSSPTKAGGTCEAQATFESEVQAVPNKVCSEDVSSPKRSRSLVMDTENNTFESKNPIKTNNTLTTPEADPCNEHQLTCDMVTPQSSCSSSSSPKSDDVNMSKCPNQAEASASSSQTETVIPARSVIQDSPTTNMAPGADQSQKDPLQSSLSDSLGLQNIDTHRANLFNLDDSLDLKSDYLLTSTPMVDCKTVSLTILREEGQNLVAQKNLYGECPSRPAGKTTSETASNIICDRKTFLTQPTSKSSWPHSKAVSQLTKFKQPGLPGRTESMMSRLPMTRQRTQVEVLSTPMTSEASQETFAGKSGSYNLRSTDTGSKLPNTGLQKPQFSYIASGIQKIGLGLRPLPARINAPAQSRDKPSTATVSVIPKTAVTKKRPLVRGETIPVAKKKMADPSEFSNGSEATASSSDVTNRVKTLRQPSTLKRALPAIKDDAPVQGESAASCDGANRNKLPKPPNGQRMLPTKASRHVCTNCVALEQQLKIKSEEIQRLKAEIVKYKKREEC